MHQSIPNHLHFIWIGPSLPWFAQLAIRSAMRACPDARVSLWASSALGADPLVCELARDARFALARLDERGLFEDADATLPLELLARLFSALSQPAARANIARLLILARFGGIYLDTDTVTFKDLTPLRSLSAFCGLEHVVWPLAQRDRRGYWVLGGAREIVRAACAYTPGGEAHFRHVESWFDRAANNAVMGFTPAHPFLLRMLASVDALPVEERARRYRLGTHLLQQSLAAWGKELNVTQLSPAHFYPLGPLLSRQYFTRRSNVQAAAQRVLSEETYLVHWYASVTQLSHYDLSRTLSEYDATLFGRLSGTALGLSGAETTKR